jgi:hypothetical protein
LSVSVVALRAVSVDFGETVELLVRLHALDMGASSNIKVIAKPVSITPEEPDVDYLGDAVATVTINSSKNVPCLLLASLTPPFGTAIQLQISGICGSASESVDATISVALVCKD